MRVFIAVAMLVGVVGSTAALDVRPDPVEAGEVVRGAWATGRVTISNPSPGSRAIEIVSPEGCRAEPGARTLEPGSGVEVTIACLADRAPGPARWRFAVIADGDGDAPPPLTLRAAVVPGATLIPEGPIDLGNAGGRSWVTTRVVRRSAHAVASPPAVVDLDSRDADDEDAGLAITLAAVQGDGVLSDGTTITPGDWLLTVETAPLPPGDHERSIRLRTGVDTDPILDMTITIRVMPLLRGEAFDWTIPDPDPDGGSFAEYVVTPRTGVPAAEVEVSASPQPFRVMSALDRRRLRVRLEIPPDPGAVPLRGEIRFAWNGETQVVPVTVGGDPPPSQPRTRTGRTRR